ncbi:MAG TPA: T9SS type A sorting domain-containing protein [Flavobacteriales bacterium]|nr:T9SS type A sorting domain-containing protein [Flavobacteriales bacterium]
MKTTSHIVVALLLLTVFRGTAFSQWSEMNTTPNNSVEKFDFITDDIGYALMTNPPFFSKTTDGGASWDSIPAPVAGVDFMDVSFPKDSVGFAVYRDMNNLATPSIIYRTIDNGSSWQNITPDSTIVGYGNSFMQFIDENIGFWSVGNILYRTIDGGISWDTTSIGPANMYFNTQSMDFYDANNGIIGIHDGSFAYLGSMFVTTDGGVTFTQTDLTTWYSVVGAVDQVSPSTSFAASSGWGSGNFMKLYRSTNGGVSWDTLDLSVQIPHTGLVLFDFIDELNGVVVVDGLFGGVHIYKTVDGGLSWSFNDSIGVAYALDIELTSNSGYYTGFTNQFFKWNGSFTSISTPVERNVNQLTLYPNPVASGSMLNWNSKIDYAYVIITDLSGKEVFRESILNNRFAIPVLSSGIYIVELGNNAMQQRAPLVIE